MPPMTPPAILPAFLCGCETDAPDTGDVAVAAGVAVEAVELGPVGGGRVRLEDDCNFEDFVVEDVVEIELELEDVVEIELELEDVVEIELELEDVVETELELEDVVEIELELEDDGLKLKLKPEEAEGVEEAAARA